MKRKKLKSIYKDLFINEAQNERKPKYLDHGDWNLSPKERAGVDYSFSQAHLQQGADSLPVPQVTRGGYTLTVSENLKFNNKDFEGIEQGVHDDRQSKSKELSNLNSSNNNIFLKELHSAIFLRILWEAAAPSKSKSSSMLRKYNASGFGDISEDFFRSLMNLSGQSSLDLNNLLASHNAEFADIYSSRQNCSWSLKMAIDIGNQGITYKKINNAFMKDEHSSLRQTNAGILHLEPYGDENIECGFIFNIYGPRSKEDLKGFENNISNTVANYFKTNNTDTVSFNSPVYDSVNHRIDSIPDASFSVKNISDLLTAEARKNEINEKINKPVISEIKNDLTNLILTQDQHDDFIKAVKDINDSNNTSFGAVFNSIVRYIQNNMQGMNDDSMRLKPNQTQVSSGQKGSLKKLSYTFFKKFDIEGNLNKLPNNKRKFYTKSSFAETELTYLFGRRSFKIKIPSKDDINTAINSWAIRNKITDRVKGQNWFDAIVLQLTGQGKVKKEMFELFPFLLTYSGSEIVKSQRSANYWSNFASNIETDDDLNDETEEFKSSSMKNFRKGWNDLRDIVDNTMNDQDNLTFSGYGEDPNEKAIDKYSRISTLGSLLSQAADDIDSVDNKKDRKIKFDKIDSEYLETGLNPSKYRKKTDTSDQLTLPFGDEEESEEEVISRYNARNISKIRSELEKQRKLHANKNIKYSLKAALLNEGMFHMMHPYEYHLSNDYKLSDILSFIDQLEEGTLEISEKLDGQNLWFTVVNGIPLFGYSLKELKTGFKSLDELTTPEPEGSTRKLLGIEKIMKTPGHGGKRSFGDGIEIVDSIIKAAYSVDENVRNKIDSIFENGNYVVSSEVIHKEGPNQILYGENFIAPHFVMDKADNSHNIEKYNGLFDVLIQGVEICNNPNDFKILTRQQRNALGSDISIFDSEEDKQRTINSLRSEYNRQILRLIEGTRLTIDSSIKDFYKEKVRNLCENPPGSDSPITLDEKDLDSLTSYVGGVSLKDSGLKSVYNYKNILSSLNLNNAANRKDFYRKNISPLIELFFDFGIDVVRNLKTTAASSENRDTAHSTIVETNIYNIKKALIISRDFKEYHENLSQEELEQLDYYKDAISLLKTINSQIPKMKKTIHRVSQKENITREEALRLICSSSIEGLVFKKTSSIDDSVLEMKLTGFFAPLNQLLNAIRFKVNSIPMLQNYLEQDGKIFSFADKGHDITDIESLLEARLILSLRHIKSLKEIYNPRTYGSNEPFEEEINEFDMACIPMSAKPFTRGHLDLVKKACERSKEVFIVASITDRARSQENPIFGKSMEKILFNKEDIITSLEDKINDLDICRDKVTVVASKNPFIDVITIFGKDFFEEYMDLNKKYAIFVGDKEDGDPYKEEMLDHIGEKLNVLYRQEDSERLSSGTQTREHLNTGLKFSEVITVLKSGKEKLNKAVDYQGQSEEGSDEYERSLDMFSRNLPEEIYTDEEIRKIYDTISDDSHEEIISTLRGNPNKRVEKALGKRNIRNLKDLYGFQS